MNTHLENITKVDFQDILKKDDLILLEFYSEFCMPCKMEAKILERIEGEREDFKLYYIDIDKNIELAKECGVLTVPTFVLFKKGEQVDKMVGFRQYNQINDLLNKYKNNN